MTEFRLEEATIPPPESATCARGAVNGAAGLRL